MTDAAAAVTDPPTPATPVTVNPVIEDMVRVVMGQTEYSEEEARQKLEAHKYNVVSVIREFMTGASSEEARRKAIHARYLPTPNTRNQIKFAEIRNLMDTVAVQFNAKQERARRMQMIQNRDLL